MLPALFAVVYILLISLGLGYLGERWVLRLQPRPLPALLSGLIGATAALSWLSLRFPICEWMHTGVAGVGLLGLAGAACDTHFRSSFLPSLASFAPFRAFASKPEPLRNEPTSNEQRASEERPRDLPIPRAAIAPSLLAAAIALASITYLASGPPRVYDTGFYHAQAVRWINEYPAVPGLANLHGRLAFNSSWFVWAALWDHGPLDGKSYHAVNAAFWVLGVLLCFQGLARVRSGRPSDLLQASLLVPLCRFQHYAASLSPELPVHVLLVYAFALLLRVGEEGEQGAPTLRRLLLLVPLLPALKLSMAPALLLVPTALWLHQRRAGWPRARAHLALAVLLGVCVLGPFLARSVVLSGYLLYPFEKFDLFALDWKVPAAEVEGMRLEVRGWAIQPWIGPEAALQPVGEWLPVWIRRNAAAHPAEMALLVLAPLLFVIALARLSRRKQWEPLLICLLPPAGLVFWFTSAPDVRFGFSWLWLGAAIPLAQLITNPAEPTSSPQPANKRRANEQPATSQRTPIAHAAIPIIALAWITAGTLRWSGAHPLLRLDPLPTVEMRTHHLPGNLQVTTPSTGDRAWNAPLPNTPLLDPHLRLRGSTLRTGFRLDPP